MRANLHLPLFPTGIGSTHHVDAADAVRDVLAAYWRMPFWPQLPNRDPLEMMLPQFGLDLPAASWDGGVLHWSGACDDAALAAAGLPPPERAAGLYAFLERVDQLGGERRPPVLKGHLVGPLTLSMAMRDPQGRAPYEDADTLRWLGAVLGQMGRMQAKAFQDLGYQALIMFDEPALASVDEPSLPIPWREATAALRAALEPVQDVDALAGLHACQPPNWTRVLDARPNMIHFDGREGRIDDIIEHKYAIRDHVARGGYLGWGLWPTDGSPPPTPFDSREMQYYLSRAARELSFVDASVGLIFKRSILTGVCGSAGLSAAQEAEMAEALEDVSMGIRKRYWIAATTDLDPDHPLT